MKGSVNSVLDAIGNTPIVKLNKVATGVESEIYVKLEFLNPGGSTKDRIGNYILEQAVKTGKLNPFCFHQFDKNELSYTKFFREFTASSRTLIS